MKKIFQMKEQSQKEAGVKDGKELHIRKNDWILIVILLVAAVGAYTLQYSITRRYRPKMQLPL